MEKINYLTNKDYNFIKKDFEKSGLSKHKYAKRLRVARTTFLRVLKTKYAAKHTAKTLLEDIRNYKKIVKMPKGKPLTEKPATTIIMKSITEKKLESLRESKTCFVGYDEFKQLSKRLQNKLKKCPSKKRQTRGIIYDFEPDLIGCIELIEDWRGDFTKNKKEDNNGI